MLIISIPKSASSSLMKTLGNLHSIRSSQVSFKNAPPPPNLNILHKYHSDIRQLNMKQAESISDNSRLFKQHIPPTAENLMLMRSSKKVILLRNPDEVIEAYYRAEIKKLHSSRVEFEGCASIEAWKQRAVDLGLLEDLEWFYSRWKTEATHFPQTSLIVNYLDLVEKPKISVNRVEDFLDLPLSDSVKLSKVRYSRHHLIVDTMRQTRQVSKAIISRHPKVFSAFQVARRFLQSHSGD